jgi:hypothetical protein
MKLHFNVATPGGEDDTGFSPEEVREWLAALASADAIGNARAIAERLAVLNRAKLTGRLRLRALDLFRNHVEWLLPQLEQRVARTQPPLAGAPRNIAHSIEKLLRELATGYARVVQEVARSWIAPGSKRQLHVPLTRAMDFYARRLALCERLYTRIPGSIWAEIHRLFRIARDLGIAQRELDSPHTSPLRIYREALLLAFAGPAKLLPGDFARVQGYLGARGTLAEIIPRTKVDDPRCVFAIDPRRDTPGVAHSKRADAGFTNGELMLLTHKLVRGIEIELHELARGTPPASLGLPNEAAQAQYRDLMQRLAVQWRGDRKHRSTRMHFHPRVDLWVGLREIWRVLRAESPQDVPAADITQREGPAPPTEWIIQNESASGYALKYLAGALPPISVGEIVAIKPRARNAIHVCLVRWIVSNSPEHFEAGLEQLAPVVLPAVYKRSEAERAAPEPILFFPTAPSLKRAPLVVAPPNRVHPNEAFSLRHRLGRLSVRASRILEVTASIELIEVAAPPSV